MSAGPVVVYWLLYAALLVCSFAKVARAFGSPLRIFEPFYEVASRECKEHVAARLAGRADSIPPVVMPAALLVPVVGVAAVISMLVLDLGFVAWQRHNELRNLAAAMLSPLTPILQWHHPLEQIDHAVFRVLICFYVALAVSAIYVAWLLRTVFRGYQRVFRDLALARPYHGCDLVASSGPSVFHAQWATYFAGALLGNVLMGFGLVHILLWLVLLVLSLPQFWQLQWSIRSWWFLYALLYITRKGIFTFVIPRYVVTDSGVVLRRRVWALLFPTLTILNLILGATSGMIRSLVIFPYLLCHFFRVDVTFLPGELSDWDWSFQPFLCLVLHTHSRLNPILLALVSELGSVHGADHVGSATTPPRRSGMEAQGPVLSSSSLSESRARQRWRLALTLARNPSLRRLRSPDLACSVASAPGCLERGSHGSDGAVLASLPPLPPRRLLSSSSFWSPLSAGGARTPLLRFFGSREAGLSGDPERG
ncbi:unnamed protein product, partial [Polarella glacialis]